VRAALVVGPALVTRIDAAGEGGGKAATNGIEPPMPISTSSWP